MIICAVVGAGSASSGCQVSTNTTAVQCTSEAECLSLGPDFAGTTCDAQTKTCVKVNADADLCKTNQECIDRAQGSPAICRKRDRKCANLLSPECPVLVAQPGELLNDKSIVIGTISPVGSVEIGDAMQKALELAQLEISKQTRGLPAVDGTTDTRPLTILTCREFFTGPQGLLRAASHLVDDVDVPIIIGPVDPSNDQYVMQSVTNPKRVLSIHPIDQLSSLADLPNPIAPTPLMWSYNFKDTNIADVTSAFVQNVLEPKVRAQGVTEPIRVAYMVEDTVLMRTTADVVEKKLRWNNKSVVENGTDGNYLRVSVGNLIDPVINPAPEGQIAKAIQDVIAFKPHIIVHAQAPLAIGPVFFNLMFAWPPTLPRPLHMDTGISYGFFIPLFSILDLLGLRNQVFSVDAHFDDAQLTRQQAWALKFKNTFPEFRSSPSPSWGAVQGYYDAVFLSAYGIVANGTKPLTGANIAQTLPSFLPPGEKVFVGPEEMTKAFGLLQSGRGIDLEGLSSDLNMDPRTGLNSLPMDITCPKVVDGKTVGFQPSGFYETSGLASGAPNNCSATP